MRFFFWIYWSRGMCQDYYEELLIRKTKLSIWEAVRRKLAVTFWLEERREKWYNHSASDIVPVSLLNLEKSYYSIFLFFGETVDLLNETRFWRKSHQDFAIFKNMRKLKKEKAKELKSIKNLTIIVSQLKLFIDQLQ